MKTIQPKKPILDKDFYCCITLSKKQLDYGSLKRRAKADGFREQTNRHITIIGGASQNKIKLAFSKLSLYEGQDIGKQLIRLLRNLKWKYTQNKVFFVSKKGRFSRKFNIIEHRRSYVRSIDLPDINVFYRKLNNLLKTNITAQFPHITLFTKGERNNPDYYGIPIPSKTEFKKLYPKRIID